MDKSFAQMNLEGERGMRTSSVLPGWCRLFATRFSPWIAENFPLSDGALDRKRKMRISSNPLSREGL
jgi:hypothetical protein